MMKSKSKIAVVWSKTDIAIEIIAQMFLFGLWLFSWVNYSELPNRIPVHYSGLKADRYGHKSQLFVMLGVLTFIYVLMSIVERFPHKMNYGRKVTEKNYKEIYPLGVRMVRALKLVIVLVMGFGVLHKQKVFTVNNTEIYPLFYVLSFVLFIGIPLYYVVKTGNVKE